MPGAASACASSLPAVREPARKPSDIGSPIDLQAKRFWKRMISAVIPAGRYPVATNPMGPIIA